MRYNLKPQSYLYAMMNFRTQIKLLPAPFTIGYDSEGLICGSCFSERIGQRFIGGKMPVTLNPYGIQFNPISILSTLEELHANRRTDPNELIQHEGRWIDLRCHGSFSASTADELIQQIDTATLQGHNSLQDARYVIITWGTAWVYEHRASGRVVANCHKLPQQDFIRRRVSVEEIVSAWSLPLSSYLQDKQVIFTVSPVRHLRDGLADNQLSKSTLIVAAHTLVEQFANCHYFPAYEIMMDDLRDYRFYDRDMIHPSDLAADYIWEQFCNWVVTPQAQQTMQRITALQQMLHHRPLHPDSTTFNTFLAKIVSEIDALQRGYPRLDFGPEQEQLRQLANYKP